MLKRCGRRSAFNVQKVADVPNVERWYATLQQRSAYRDHVMLPFDDMYGRLSF